MELWFRFNGPRGHKWSVFLADPACTRELIYPNKKLSYRGLCIRSSRCIIINAGYKSEIQFETVIHELLHASYTGKRLSGALEEHAVGSIEENLATALRSIGFKLPKKPTSYRCLRRRAKRSLEKITKCEYTGKR